MDTRSTADRISTRRNVSWEAFEAYLTKRGDELPRVAYLGGTLELMSPSRDHDKIRRRFAALVDAYLVHLGVRFDGCGSW